MNITITDLLDVPVVVSLLETLAQDIHDMRQELQDAVAALTAAATDAENKLETVINGIPTLVGAAVTQALAEANVEEGQAADLITAATDTVRAEVDKLVAVATVPDASQPGGNTAATIGNDTLSGGQGNDAIVQATADPNEA